MKTFVQKKIATPIRRSSFQTPKKTQKKSKKNRKKIGFFFLRLVILWSVSLWIYLVIKNIIFRPENTIHEVIISEKTQNHYHNPLLKKIIEKNLIKKNSIIVRWFWKNELKQTLKEQFPFIQKITISSKDSSSVMIDIDFQEPEIIFLQKDKKLASVNWKIFSISSGDARWIDIIKIHLPDYWNPTNLSGIFYKINHQTLLQQISLIQEKISGIMQIIYIPGGSKIIVKTKDMSIYFDNSKSLEEQIDKLLLLQQNYRDFWKIKEIDLSSLDTPIIKKPKTEPENKIEKSQ